MAIAAIAEAHGLTVLARNSKEFEPLCGSVMNPFDALPPLRRLDVTPRTLDALHIAIAQRIDADLATSGDKMAIVARFLGSKMTAI